MTPPVAEAPAPAPVPTHADPGSAAAAPAAAPPAPLGPATPPPWPPVPAPAEVAAGALDRAWRVKVGPDAGATGMALAGDVVAVATWSNAVVALDRASGQERWRAAEPGTDESIDRPALAGVGDDVVVAWPAVPRVEGRDARTGAVTWTVPLNAPPQALTPCDGTRAVVVAARGMVDGRPRTLLRAIDSHTGAALWTKVAPGAILGTGDGSVWVGPAMRAGAFRVGARDPVVALRCDDGEVVTRWTPPRAHVDLRQVEPDGRALLTSFDRPVGSRMVCAIAARGDVDANPAAATCVDSAAWTGAQSELRSAALVGPHLWLAGGHMLARNLDPTPDAELVAIDLRTLTLVGRSEPDTSDQAIVGAGPVQLTAFGSTGAKDRVHLVDPSSLRSLRSATVDTAPQLLAVDTARAYVATYDGSVHAFALPSPGPQAPAPRVLTAQAQPSPEDTVAALVPAWSTWPLRRDPALANDEVVLALALTPARKAASARLWIGGTDDRVREVDPRDGRVVAVAPDHPGGNVTALRACDDGERVLAAHDGGQITAVRGEGAGVLAETDLGLGRAARNAWAVHATPDCSRVIVTGVGRGVDVFEPGTPAPVRSLDSLSTLDGRGHATQGWWFPAAAATGRGLMLYDLHPNPAVAAREAPGLEPPTLPGPTFSATQVLALADGGVVVEHCSLELCRVRFVGPDGQLGRHFDFDASGAGWVPTVPSALVVDEAAGVFAWGRRELEPAVVRVVDDARVYGPAIDGALELALVTDPAGAPLRLVIAGGDEGRALQAWDVRWPG